MRHYEKGLVAGETDPPVGTLKDWITAEIRNAERLIVPGDAGQYWVASATGRLGTLKECLHQLERRG